MIDDAIKIISINVNKSSPPTENALNIAIERNTDIILVQEPWFYSKSPADWRDQQSTKHPSFTQIFPNAIGSERPRTMAYISKRFTPYVNLSENSPLDGDLQILEVSIKGQPLAIINIYNNKGQGADKENTFYRHLKALTLPKSCILIGDFNAHHPWWEPEVRNPSTHSKELAEWFTDNNLTLLNKPGQATFIRSSTVIDLALVSEAVASRPYAFTSDPSLCSDHYGLILEFPHKFKDQVDNPLAQGRYNTSKANWAEFHRTIKIENSASILPAYYRECKALANQLNPIDHIRGTTKGLQRTLDQMAEELTEIITNAAEKAIPHRSISPHAKAWWNDGLSQMRKELARERYHLEDSFLTGLWDEDRDQQRIWKNKRNSYFAAIKDTKTQHWNEFLTKGDAKSIFRAFKYTNSSSVQKMPKIRDSSKALQSTFEGKCSAFRSALFQKPPQAEPPQWDEYQANNKWEWPELSYNELKHACSPAILSKSPGPDGITQDIITQAFEAIPEAFYQLYGVLFQTGYHPTSWRRATGAVLPKANKADYAEPKSYRIITLLNCLGKITERIIAQRLNYLAETTDLLSESQIGGRMKKSAIDAAMLLRNWVEGNKQSKEGHKVTTLFLDVKGAYDHVAKQRLLQILADLHLPANLISWVDSFLSQRLLRVAFDGELEEFSPVESGIPQGSPVSPVLFLIYIRDLFKSKAVKWISYVDDISLTTSSISFARNIELLEREAAKLVELANSNNIAFDLEKTELIHWEWSKISKKNTLRLPDGKVIEPKKMVKWLGIFFDCYMNFKHHVATKVAKAKSAFLRVARLASIENGLSPHALRQLYMACVTSIADYGAIIWWKDQVNFTQQLQKLQSLAVRKILGVFKTAPIMAMEVECALPPPDIRIRAAIRMYALRIHQLSPSHPINAAIDDIYRLNPEEDYQPGDFRPHLHKIHQSIAGIVEEEMEPIQHFFFKPWERSTPYSVMISSLSKDDETTAHLKSIQTASADDIYIYTDASSNATKDNKGIGVGIATINTANQTIKERFKRNIGKGNLVYNGELEGATLAAEIAADQAEAGLHFHIFSDNQAGLWRLKTPSDKPGQANQIRAIEAGKQIAQAGAQLTYHWVPGHKDIRGNEEADSLAKDATKQDPRKNQMSYAMLGTIIKQKRTAEWKRKLEEHDAKNPPSSNTSYRRLFNWKISEKLRTPPCTNRKIASAFNQLKIGHGNFREYLHRIKVREHPLCIYCYEKETPEHLLLHCKPYEEQRQILRDKLEEKNITKITMETLMATPPGIEATLEFLESTRICTMAWLKGRDDLEEPGEEEEEERTYPTPLALSSPIRASPE